MQASLKEYTQFLKCGLRVVLEFLLIRHFLANVTVFTLHLAVKICRNKTSNSLRKSVVYASNEVLVGLFNSASHHIAANFYNLSKLTIQLHAAIGQVCGGVKIRRFFSSLHTVTSCGEGVRHYPHLNDDYVSRLSLGRQAFCPNFEFCRTNKV